jgi:hypothetical protein
VKKCPSVPREVGVSIDQRLCLTQCNIHYASLHASVTPLITAKIITKKYIKPMTKNGHNSLTIPKNKKLIPTRVHPVNMKYTFLNIVTACPIMNKLAKMIDDSNRSILPS